LEKYQLAVAVKEQEYLKRLSDYIRDSKFGELWQVTGFTHAEACKAYVKQGYSISLIAAQPDLLAEIRSELPGVPAIALVLKLGDSSEEYELHQYQPLPLLLQRLTEVHARAAAFPFPADVTPKGASGVKVISVYSAAGGTGKTALALHLVHAASTYGSRAFYLNLERWNTAEDWLGPEDQASGQAKEGMSELLYGLKAQPDQSVSWLMEHRKRSSLLQGDYLAPWTNVEDRMTLSEEEAAGLVNAAAGSGQYDLIVIDMESGLEELHATIFEKSTQVIWLQTSDASVKNKQELALRYGVQKWGSRFHGLLPRFISVNNFAVAAANPSLSPMGSISRARAELPEILEWRGASRVKLLSSPLYRAAADKLLKQLSVEEG
jgi:cellulose biosynthesis protein BcsQ